MVGAMRSTLAALLTLRAASFAVQELLTDQATVDKLYAAATGWQRDAMANGLLLPALQAVADQIVLEQGDMEVQERFPDTYIDNDCQRGSVQLQGTTAVGRLMKTTIMKFGSSGVWRGAPVFVDAVLDAQLNIETSVCVKLGRMIFHRCTQIAQKTVGLNLVSHGRTALGVTLNITSSNIEPLADGSLAMVFTFSASVVGTVLDWNVDEVTANRCYIVKILGTEIGSICGTIRDEVMKRKEQFMNQVRTLQASPQFQAKLERAVKAKMGSRIVVPLKVATEAAVGSSVARAVAEFDVANASARAAEALAGAAPQAAAYSLVFS